MAGNPRRYSRFQVRCEGVPAWAVDDRRKQFYFDGLRFWFVGEGGRRRVKASWQAPVHGWEHDGACACRLCEGDVATRPRWVA